MNLKKIVLSLAIGLQAFSLYPLDRYVGGDISLLPEYENAGAIYKDLKGEPVADLLPFLKENGMNAMRVRLFVNPKDYNGGDADPNACQDLDYIIPLCKRIKEQGFSLLLDFHYSDTWADPAKQWTPESWKDLSDEQLYAKIYDYTKETLQSLKENGVTPDFIQPGNEISFGMLWGAYGSSDNELKKTYMGSDANWERLGKLLNQAIKGCKEECPAAKIVIHTERVSDVAVQNNFYNWMGKLNVEYDVIGLSYYPYFHGNMDVLNAALTSLESEFPEKNIMIVETGYPYKWEVPGTDQKVDYPYSESGQDEFAKELVETLENHSKVNGLFWWWLEYNAYNTKLEGWYNAPLFDSTTGKACMALKTICSFAAGAGAVDFIESTADGNNDRWYDLNGREVKDPKQGIFIQNRKKILIR